jgi:hypothetical protein
MRHRKQGAPASMCSCTYFAASREETVEDAHHVGVADVVRTSLRTGNLVYYMVI